MRYFRKELPNRTLFRPDGSAVSVRILDKEVGVIVTDDAALIEWLDTIVGTQGVSAISEADFDDLKKKTRLSNYRDSLAQAAKSPRKLPGFPRPDPKIVDRKKCRSCGGRGAQ